ncbi:MAG: D-alanine--D-alanine ligase [Flavobacteriales bacterium]|nr:D-alanine--D-alanine ligase [Flavobacteriales bacterium]
MKTIAVVCGGYSGEDVISHKSAQNIMSNIDRSKYRPFLVDITKNCWRVQFEDHWVVVDKDDFSFLHFETKTTFDGVFMMIHGTPGENGLLQGYFATLDLPVTTGDVLNMALTFNKFATNAHLQKLGFNVAKNEMILEGDSWDSNKLVSELGLPLFVKPNESGSSLGISKVNKIEDLDPAIDHAFTINDSVMVESFLEGREISSGVIVKDGKVLATPPTEIISDNDFFDFEAKYEGSSQEITPAEITPEETELIQRTSEQIYKILHCKGFIRVDYMLHEGKAQIIEVNTVPGFSNESILPQQIEASGWTVKEAITHCIEQMFT